MLYFVYDVGEFVVYVLQCVEQVGWGEFGFVGGFLQIVVGDVCGYGDGK